MTDKKLTLGQAIDQIIAALEALEPDSRINAIAAASAHLNLKIAPETPAHVAATQTMVQAVPAVGQSVHAHREGKVDIRSLKQEKNPDSAKQMACVVAYYLQELAPEDERKNTISAQDLEKYFKQANFKLPKAMAQVLVDAKKSGYFEGGTRGEYKLNAVGYNLVAHGLPTKKAS
ncbi:MAG: hypothetical protein IPM20_00630 [Gammaproteobacteria bacterium]|nr:hypothetical protein [Gammaproteobacteria bacterium]